MAANAPRTGDVLKKQQTEYVNTGGGLHRGWYVLYMNVNGQVSSCHSLNFEL